MKKRLKKLEALAASMIGQDNDMQHLSPQEREERVRYLVGKMTEKEITAFEERHGFTEGYIKGVINQ